MEFFRIKKDIPFMRHALVFNVISLLTFVLAVFFLVTKGLHLSVEFTGGTLIEVKYEQSADLEKIRSTLGSSGFGVVPRRFGGAAGRWPGMGLVGSVSRVLRHRRLGAGAGGAAGAA